VTNQNPTPPEPWKDRDQYLTILRQVDWNINDAVVVMGCSYSTARSWFKRHQLAADRPYTTGEMKGRGGAQYNGVSTTPPPVVAGEPVDETQLAIARTEEARLSAKRAQEVEKYRAQVRALKAENRELAKNGDVIGTISDLLAPVVVECRLPPPEKVPKRGKGRKTPVSVVAHWTDWHWGELVDPEQVAGHNAYSPGIAALRVQRLVDTMLTWIDHYDELHGVAEVVIVLNGDMASGMDNIHPEQATEYARIAVQILDCALVAAQAIRDVAGRVKRVRIVATRRGGNHTRSKRKMPLGAAAAETSWEAVWVEYLAALLKDARNVVWQLGNAYKIRYDVQGVPCAAAHGDLMRGGGGQLGIPAYALKRLHDATVKRSMQAARRDAAAGADPLAALARIVKHLRIGHFHTYVTWGIDDGDIAICPSLKGVDAFVMDALERYSPAAQLLEVIHPRRDVIGTHVIGVQDVMTDDDPCRYSWGAMQSDSPSFEILNAHGD
jgi:hypothetical protein